MKSLRSFWICLLLFAALDPHFVARAQDMSSSFDAANKLYNEGKFAEAAAAYNQLLASGNCSEALYFNRGNAYFKQGQTGRAVASYLQAQRLAPRDLAVRTNLQFARVRARGGLPYQLDRWHGFFGKLSLNEWAGALAVAFWLLFIFLAILQWRPELKSALRDYCFIVGAFVVLLGVCLFIALNQNYFTSAVVVITGEAEVRNGPLDEAPSNFKVRDGIELTILDQKEGWLEVVDAAQRTGWLRGDQVIAVGANDSAKPGS